MTRNRVRNSLGVMALITSLAVGSARAELLSGPADAVLGPPQRAVLAADANRTVIQLTFPVDRAPADWNRAGRVEWQGVPTEDRDPGTGEIIHLDPVVGFHVAVPERRLPGWRIAGLQWHRQPADPAAAVVTVGGPTVYRGVPLATVTVHVDAGGGVLAGIVVEIDHPAPVAGRTDADSRRRAAREGMPASVVNAEQFGDLRSQALAAPRPADKVPLPDYFDLTTHWVRLEVDELDVYTLGGSELQAMGVTLADVDPEKLRLYKGGGLTLDDDPENPANDEAALGGLNELTIVVDDGGDGEFDPEDRILFYGFGTDVWLDRLDPTGGPIEFYNHPHEAHGIYWLTWEDHATASPLPGQPRRVATTSAAPTGGDLVEQYRARYHGEDNVVYAGGYTRDNWVWDSAILSTFFRTFNLEGVVTGQSADWNFDVVALHTNGFDDKPDYQTVSWLNQDQAFAVAYSWRYRDQMGLERVRISGSTTDVRAGANTATFRYDNFQATSTFLAFDSFDVRYDASLDKRRYPGSLQCVLWGDEITVPGTANDVRFTLPADGTFTVWDVSQPDSAVVLDGSLAGADPRELTVGLVREPGESRHLVLFTDGDLRQVSSGARVTPSPLRLTVPAADYLVIYAEPFAAAAQQMASLRSQSLPGLTDPRAVSVLVDDIYDNFSGGQKDWRAIRQFVRWHYLQHGQRLRWVCLVGDASRDYRNFLGQDPNTELYDWVPTCLTTEFPWTSFPQRPLTGTSPYVADEAMVALDAPPSIGSIDFDAPDLAIGRLPATDPNTALQLVDQIRSYEEDLPSGRWRNEVVFCADDLDQGSHHNQYQHTQQAEVLANEYVPMSVDVDKVYLLDYPFVGSYKPDARRALLSELDEGATIFYYVGHGSAEILADEQVFRIDDIAGLTNGERRFLFMAFSCDVGVFDDPFTQCMGEEFVTATQGGAIASITASWVSYTYSNDDLSNAFCSTLYPDRGVARESTVGESLTVAKTAMYGSLYNARNARRYNIMGDPALHLPNPLDDLRFSVGTADSLLTGRLHEVGLDLSQAGLSGGPDVTYRLRVQESSVDEPYYYDYVWRRLGNDVFRGNGTLFDDQPVVPFQAPINLRLGEQGRFRCIVADGDLEWAAVSEAPVVQVAAPSDDIQGPAIALGFDGGRIRVRPGDLLGADLQDPSGVNILATNPANSILLEFDGSGIYSNVSSDVVFEAGSYTHATLNTSLPPGLELGPHVVVMSASDMFGNVGRDTLSFELEAASVAAMRDATVFPNPTPGPCRLVVDLSAAMDLQWDIYTVAGRRVRSIRAAGQAAGPAILIWDGRDGEGDEIANGTYLYVLRGQVAGDSHGFRETGQLVIMR